MGIKALSLLIKDLSKKNDQQNPEIVLEIDNEDELLRGLRVAVDVGNLFFMAGKYAQHKAIEAADLNEDIALNQEIFYRHLLEGVLNYIIRILKCGSIPILVFDGKSPIKKETTIQNRTKSSKKREETLDELIDRYINLDIFDAENKSILLREIRQKQSNMYYVNRELKKRIFDDLESLGFICLQAEEEGDFVCTSLVHNNYAAYIFSTDSDMLAAGCAFLVTKIEGYYKKVKITAKRLDMILNLINLDYNQFLDFCIMTGTDFNSNVKGFGCKRVYKALEKYENYENYSEAFPEKDLECIDYYNMKDLFTDIDLESKLKDKSLKYLNNMNMSITGEKLNILNDYNLNKLADDIITYGLEYLPETKENQKIENVSYLYE